MLRDSQGARRAGNSQHAGHSQHATHCDKAPMWCEAPPDAPSRCCRRSGVLVIVFTPLRDGGVLGNKVGGRPPHVILYEPWTPAVASRQ